jgi:hypothetical protein
MAVKALVVALCVLLSAHASMAQRSTARGVARPQKGVPHSPVEMPDTILTPAPLAPGTEVVTDEISAAGDSLRIIAADSVPVLTAGEALGVLEADSIAPFPATAAKTDEWEPRDVEFTPDPTKAVWMSALFPGLGQIYNRRYWKLPIIVGGYLGLAYATDWNNTMLTDYTNAYRDLLDNDPSTKSYMDLFAPNVNEEDIDKTWLQSVLRSRRNYFRRNRDLCIIGMVGVYLLAMVDAYVDASLSHFDISPDLSMDVVPSFLKDGRNSLPSVGLTWALNF